MLLRDANNYIEIEAVNREPEESPIAGDTEFSVEVCSSGFRGQTFAWIEAKCLQDFLTELTELENRRQGSATLRGYGPPPREFVLQVWSVDRWGHMAIGGRLTKLIYRGEKGPYDHAVEFAFEFDPTLLPKLLAEFRTIADGHE